MRQTLDTQDPKYTNWETPVGSEGFYYTVNCNSDTLNVNDMYERSRSL